MTQHLQAFLDLTVPKIIAQGHRSTGKDAMCLYRSNGGKSACLIGMAIPDDRYEPNFDKSEGNMSLDDILELGVVEHLTSADSQFAYAVRECHDMAEDDDFVEDFKRRIAKVAEKYNLTVPA